MIWKNRKYRWIDFSDDIQNISMQDNGYGIFIQNEVHPAVLRTDTFDRANYHGGYSSETLAGGRLFTFDCILVGNTKAKRHIAWNSLVAILQPDPNPWALGRGFYDLDFKDDWGNDRTVKVKVFTVPTPDNGLDDPTIRFTFELYAEEEKIYWTEVKSETWTVGYLGGTTLPMTLPTTLSWYIGKITVNNEWNWAAPIRVSLVWNAVNPKIKNVTNGNIYRIDKTTSNLVFDNRNLDNDATKRLVVTDNWTDIRAYRSSGASVYLDPGENELVVLTDNYDTTNIVTITWRDSHLY